MDATTYDVVGERLDAILERVFLNCENRTQADYDRIKAEKEAVCAEFGVALSDWEEEVGLRIDAKFAALGKR